MAFHSEVSTLVDAVRHAKKRCHWCGIIYALPSYCSRIWRSETRYLVAIAGLAKDTCKVLGGQDQYLAGPWRRDVLNGLLWCRGDSFIKRCTPSEDYHAPSWSWESFHGHIDRPQTTNSEFYVTLVDAQLDYVTEDTFRQVKNGYIRLRGPLQTITFEKKKLDTVSPIFDELHEHSQFPLRPRDSGDETTVPLPEDLSLEYYYDAFLNGKKLVDEHPAPYVDISDDMLQQPLHFMPFCKGFGGDYQRAAHFGLLLQPTGKARGQFTRCGLLVTPSRDAVERDAVEKAGFLDRSCVRNHDWLDYDEFDGKEYTISII
jgi:hypothetical protein